MTWFAVDDSFHGHPKLAELEQGKHFAAAVALWTLAGSWCAYHLTDGRVPAAQLRKLVPFQAAPAAAELVRVELWQEVEGGYQFRDWADYQPTKDEVEARREKGAARTRKSRNRAKQRVTEDACNAVTQPVTGDVTNASVTLSRPDPSPSLTTFVSEHATGPIVGGIDPESVRRAYLARWETHAKGKRPPMVARGFGAPIWSELAHEFVDRETTEAILDRAFVDPFVTSTGWTPQAIRGAAQRLSTVDVRSSGAEKAPEPVTEGNPAIERFEAAKRRLDAVTDPDEKRPALQEFYAAQRALAQASVRGAA